MTYFPLAGYQALLTRKRAMPPEASAVRQAVLDVRRSPLRGGARPPSLRPRRGQPERPRRPYSVTRMGTQPILIAVPALVSAELFATANKQRAENRRRYRQARCPLCQHRAFQVNLTFFPFLLDLDTFSL